MNIITIGLTKQRVVAIWCIVCALVIGAFYIRPHTAHADTFSPINSSLHVGSQNTDVSNLQTFLKSDSDIYPQGITSGYYGTLTKNAVMQFQLAYGLTADGIAGPNTIAKMNRVITSGYGLDISAPVTSNITVQTNANNTATISWTTDTPATGSVYYSNSFPVLADSSTNFQLPAIGGTQISDTQTVATTTHSVTIPSLTADTPYYYTIENIDQSGNVGVVWPTLFQIP